MKLFLPFTCGLLAASTLPVCAQTAPPALKWTTRSNAITPAGAEITAQAPRARAILDAYQKQNPVPGERVMRLVYWTPADREPAPRYRERLSEIMRDIQAFYRREMARNGLGPISFRLPEEGDGGLQMFVARGDKPRSAYSGESGQEIRRDALRVLKEAGIDGDKETILIFCNLANWNAQTRDTQDGGAAASSSPYYAGGSTRQGTAWQSDSPILNLPDLLDVSDANRVKGQYGETTLARYNAIFIGGIAHELGHALSMPHNNGRVEMDPWGRSLMGAGNRTYGEELRRDVKNETRELGSFLPLSDAMRLASHPSFSGSVKGFDDKSDSVLSDIQLSTDGKNLRYAARVTAAKAPVYGVIGYFDPEGGGDYDSRTYTAVPDQNGDFSFTCSATDLVAGKGGQLRVVPLQANGATVWGNEARYSYSVASDGAVDLTAWENQQQLSPLLAALKNNDRAGAQRALAGLQLQKAAPLLIEIARVQVAAFDQKLDLTPAQSSGEGVWLSETQPTSAKVGYLTPTYNRLPHEGDPEFFSAGKQLFARGIYAHAPARHVYDLGGRWNRLTGAAGMLVGHGGQVGFTLLADGKPIWKSEKVAEGDPRTFDVSVAGVQSLELVVDDGGNGTGADWGVWLDPKLTR